MTQVLIVEDHEDNRNLLKLLLQANGARTQHLRLFRERRYQLPA